MSQWPDELVAAPSRVLVTGSTTWSDAGAITDVLDRLLEARPDAGGSFRIITGMAPGADEIARRWASNHADQRVSLFAEPLRLGAYPHPMHDYNHLMLKLDPDVVVAFKERFDPSWAGSICVAGTEHMCRIAAEADIPVVLNGSTVLAAGRRHLSPPGGGCNRGTMQPMHETRWHNTLVQVVQGDITTEQVDVVVNAANSSLLGGGGVDGAIHRAAGPELLDACREVVARQGGCDTGEAVITHAGQLPADYVVHTVGPVWTGNSPDDHDALLARCYTESLRLTDEADATSVALPNISTGVYRFPLDRAAQVATSAVRTWLEATEHNIAVVRFVCFNQENFDLYATAFDNG